MALNFLSKLTLPLVTFNELEQQLGHWPILIVHEDKERQIYYYIRTRNAKVLGFNHIKPIYKHEVVWNKTENEILYFNTTRFFTIYTTDFKHVDPKIVFKLEDLDQSTQKQILKKFTENLDEKKIHISLIKVSWNEQKQKFVPYTCFATEKILKFQLKFFEENQNQNKISQMKLLAEDILENRNSQNYLEIKELAKKIEIK
ncbi:hypothetical protein NV226_01925 [Mycoplasma iguanae]|uniref:Uncharacterized protein n=1 Tax=Mycoplasma iguanae TaxID=292461 RepID=A0ABY5R7J5_9MOLU|nr:hypothetical protein [Mycoplasma iguanae]UVD81473.1 hypothetical protein NV226_01925 [Mycoplasma iguanae]